MSDRVINYGVSANSADTYSHYNGGEANQLIYDRGSSSGSGGRKRSSGGRDSGYLCGIQSKGAAYMLVSFFIVSILGAAGFGCYAVINFAEKNKEPRKHSMGACFSPFGGFCGCVGNVSAFSNCNGAYMSNEANFIEMESVSTEYLMAKGVFGAEAAADEPALTSKFSIYTGMKFQCVEYSRRFLIASTQLGRHVTFGDVVGASNIFAIENVTSIFNSSVVYRFDSYLNGQTSSQPQFGDLIIYPIQGTTNDFPFGHVAVVNVVDLDRMVVLVGEQNWANAVWPSSAECGIAFNRSQYAREIPLRYNSTTGTYALVDESFIIDGWKRVGERIL